MDCAKSKLLSAAVCVYSIDPGLPNASFLARFERFIDRVFEAGGDDAIEFVHQALLSSWRRDNDKNQYIQYDQVPDYIPGHVIKLAKTMLGSHWSCRHLLDAIVGDPLCPRSKIALLPFSISGSILPCHLMTLVKAQPDPVGSIVKWLNESAWSWGWNEASEVPVFSEMIDLLTTHFGDGGLPTNVSILLIRRFGHSRVHGSALFELLLGNKTVDQLFILIDDLYSDRGYSSEKRASVSRMMDIARRQTFEIVLATNYMPVPGVVQLIVDFAVDLSWDAVLRRR